MRGCLHTTHIFLLMMSGAHSYEIKDEPLAALTAKQALL